MKRRIPTSLAIVLSSFALLAASVALADGHRVVAPPHAIALKLEPSYVTAGSTAKVIATFTPGVDIESLRVNIWLDPEVRTDPACPRIIEWREKARKGEAIVVSAAAMFSKPGRYLVGVSYWHAETHGPWVLRANTINFHILVPGGIETVKPEDKLPSLMKEAPDGMVDTVREGQLLHFPVGAQTGSARDSMVGKRPGGAGGDSIVTAFVTLSSAGNTLWAETTRIIATCDKLINNNYIDLNNWCVVPASLGSIVELPDHRARFTAGSTAGVGTICADDGDTTFAWPVMVIANYEIYGRWWYEGRDAGEYLPWVGSVVRLYTVDSQSTDQVTTACFGQEFHYRLVDTTCTDGTGFYEFNDLNVDSIMVEIYTKRLSTSIKESQSEGKHMTWSRSLGMDRIRMSGMKMCTCMNMATS